MYSPRTALLHAAARYARAGAACVTQGRVLVRCWLGNDDLCAFVCLRRCSRLLSCDSVLHVVQRAVGALVQEE